MVQLQVIIFVFSVLSFSLTIMFHILPSYNIGTKGIRPKPHYRMSKAENICGLRYSLIQEKRKEKAGGEQTNKNQQEKQVMQKKKKAKQSLTISWLRVVTETSLRYCFQHKTKTRLSWRKFTRSKLKSVQSAIFPSYFPYRKKKLKQLSQKTVKKWTG